MTVGIPDLPRPGELVELRAGVFVAVDRALWLGGSFTAWGRAIAQLPCGRAVILAPAPLHPLFLSSWREISVLDL